MINQEDFGPFDSGRTAHNTRVISVAHLNRWVAGLIDQSLPSLWVSGEVRNFIRAASGHWYFTLKDANAEVRCAMFAGNNRRLGFLPRNGDKLEIHAKAGLYQPRGDFQLVADSMRYAGLGQLYEEFLRLKAQLQSEGLFAQERKKPLAGVYFRIGVVTSLKAAALRDVISTLSRRAPYARIVIYPCAVQGQEAPSEIAQALLRANERNDVDVLLLVRGGGSLQDLWAFNSELVARTLVQMRLPVICGVGHESDQCIADWVCDVRAATPTAAAELVTPTRASLLTDIQGYRKAMLGAMQYTLQTQEQRLDWMTRHLKTPADTIAENFMRIQALKQDFSHVWRACYQTKRSAWMTNAHALAMRKPDTDTSRIELLRHRLDFAFKERLQLSSAKVKQMRLIFENTSPDSILKLGYAMLTDDHGHVLSRTQDVQVGQTLTVRLNDGAIRTTVQERIEQSK